MTRTLTLTGAHPYTRLQVVLLELDLLDAVPGRELNYLDAATAAPGVGEAWVKLAGPYYVEGGHYQSTRGNDIGAGVVENELRLLLGLVWDLQGRSFTDTARTRRPANWIAVETAPGSVCIYRDATEVEGKWLSDGDLVARSAATVPTQTQP